MKNTTIAILLIIGFISCRAQNPIISLDSDIYPRTENAYYKDTEGDLQELVGTWLYINGNEVFKIIIKKREQELTDLTYPDITYYEDILYGEYRYVDENGYELVNTLANIDDPNAMSVDHLIWGNDIKTSPFNPPKCESCPLGQHRVQLAFTDPQRAYLGGEATLRVIPDPFDQYTEERMELVLDGGAGIKMVPQGQSLEPRIPYGTYILTKQ